MITMSLGTAVVHLGCVFAPNHFLLSPAALLAVLQVLLPLLLGPELAHLDLTGSVVICGAA